MGAALEDDEKTEPGMCACVACVKAAHEAARVRELWERESITQVMTCVDLRKEVTVFVSRESGRIDAPVECLKGVGRSQLEALEDALSRRGAG